MMANNYLCLLVLLDFENASQMIDLLIVYYDIFTLLSSLFNKQKMKDFSLFLLALK